MAPKLIFSTVTTITEGSLTVGTWVEMENVLTRISTGKHHRTVKSAGQYVGTSWEPDLELMYHVFEGGYVGDVPQTMHALPVNNFK